MMNKRVTVLARLKAKEGMEEKVKEELMALVGPSRSEKGCINYDLHQGTKDPTLFMFYENWLSQEDLEQHSKMPYLQAFGEVADEMLAEPVKITLWEMIS